MTWNNADTRVCFPKMLKKSFSNDCQYTVYRDKIVITNFMSITVIDHHNIICDDMQKLTMSLVSMY